MYRTSATVLAGAVAMASPVANATQQPQTGKVESSKTATPSAQEVTLSGCLRQTSDDPGMFALVRAADPASTTRSASSAAQSPLYRLDDKGQLLKGHVGQHVEVRGTVTPAPDEKGPDVVTTRRENIGVPTTVVTTVDLKPAPRLDVKAVKRVPGTCAPPANARSASAAPPAAGAAAARAVSVGDISEHPERYLGQTVVVRGEIEQVFSPSVFSLDEDRVFSAGVDVLVISKRPGVAKEDRRATVTGVVRRFVRAEMQKEIVDFDLRPEWLVDFETRPVIVATDVTLAR